MAEGQKGGLRMLPGRRNASGRQKSRTVVREIMIVFGAVLALGVIAVGVISALIVEKTPSQAQLARLRVTALPSSPQPQKPLASKRAHPTIST